MSNLIIPIVWVIIKDSYAVFFLKRKINFIDVIIDSSYTFALLIVAMPFYDRVINPIIEGVSGVYLSQMQLMLMFLPIIVDYLSDLYVSKTVKNIPTARTRKKLYHTLAFCFITIICWILALMIFLIFPKYPLAR